MQIPFKDRLTEIDPSFLSFHCLKVLQVNLGDRCNLSCTHCHVEASPFGRKVMGVAVMEKIVLALSRTPGITLDITGGCPEMNPYFRFLLERTRGLSPRRIVRTNLAIMAEAGMEWLPLFLREQETVLTASLPCYLEENVDRQRGGGVHGKSIAVLRELNRLGYGHDLELNLVYNPAGLALPSCQQELESAYRQEMLERYGIVFTRLLTITNAPVGRFRSSLEAGGKYEKYLAILAGSFNPQVAANIMCRTLVSVDWQGVLYNCDFNQALGLPLTAEGRALTIDDLEEASLAGHEIAVSDHCYSCTAGHGSSCAGSLAA